MFPSSDEFTTYYVQTPRGVEQKPLTRATFESTAARARRNRRRMAAMQAWDAANPGATSAQRDAALAKWEAENA